MATEHSRRRIAAAALLAFASLLLAPAAVSAQTATPAPTPRPVPPSEPWWMPVAFTGRPVIAVRASGDTIAVDVTGVGQQRSTDGGRTWQRYFERHGLVIAPDPHWRVIDGRVAHVNDDGSASVDPGSPSMPAGGRPQPADQRGLIAAPAALPGVVVAVDVDGVAWRRGADGHWARALLLLPQGIGSGAPRITSLVAFDTQPLSAAVYLGTDGYSVLASNDDSPPSNVPGDDWFRAGPGLPDHVLALYADPVNQAVYAGTDDGLWVHHLRAIPAPPVYADAALRWRWLGIGLVTLVASTIAVAGLLRAVR